MTEPTLSKLLMQGTFLYKKIMTRIVEPHGLTFTQYQALKVICDQPGLSAKEMLDILDTDKATLSGVITRLEERHLIERRANRDDRRLRIIEATSYSHRMIETIETKQREIEESLFTGMRNKDRKFLLDRLKQVLKNQHSTLIHLKFNKEETLK